MKIALYIEDGLEQIVLTPQSDTEKAILGKLHDGSRELEMKQGSFFYCMGGWVRHGIAYTEPFGRTSGNDESTMVVLRTKPKPEPEPEVSDESRASEMVQRLAMAAVAYAGSLPEGSHDAPFIRSHRLGLATAMLRMLRYPTEPMLSALRCYAQPAGDTERGWEAAIDAALNGPLI